MTQTGFALKLKRQHSWASYQDLFDKMEGYTNRNVYKRQVEQTVANAAAALEEVSGETIHDITDASKALEVWQKTDQVATDGGIAGTVEWQTVTGAVTEATFTTSAVATTTHVPLVAAVTTARELRAFQFAMAATDELLIGNAAGTEIFGVIKVGYHQLLKGSFMAATGRRSFLGKIKLTLNVATAVTTLIVTYTPVGETLAKTFTFATKDIETTWEPCLELAAASRVSMTINDDNAAHPVAKVDIEYLEAW
jgi:hypothetical protein